MRSTDSGFTWRSDPGSLSFFLLRLKALTITSQENVLAVGSDLILNRGVILWSKDGVKWYSESVSQPLNDVAMRNDSVGIAVGDGGIIYSNNTVISGVRDVRKKEEFTLFPNPSLSYFSVHGNTELITNISVFDVSGRLLIYAGIIPEQMDVYALNSGMYKVVIETKKARFVGSVIGGK
ncbi:MAG: hypothetical protein ACI9GM_000856 [Salibacteraceae bacterium]|jgi:hypothetical protein